MKLTALSAATGIPRSTLHNKVRGNSDLTVTELVQLAIALDVSAVDLIAAAIAGSDDHDPGVHAYW